MLQLRRMRWFFCLPLLLLASCGLPAPYQTYSPGQVVPPPPVAPLAVFNLSTPSPDLMTNFSDTAPASPFLPPPPTAPTSTPTQGIAICYNRLWNSPETVRSAAVQACGNESNAQIVTQGVDLDACPLLTPTHAVFACAAKKQSSR